MRSASSDSSASNERPGDRLASATRAIAVSRLPLLQGNAEEALAVLERWLDENLGPESEEGHLLHCEIAGCKHPALYELKDGTTMQGWCARCRVVAHGGVYEGVTFRHGKIVDAETGEPLD